MFDFLACRLYMEQLFDFLTCRLYMEQLGESNEFYRGSFDCSIRILYNYLCGGAKIWEEMFDNFVKKDCE